MEKIGAALVEASKFEDSYEPECELTIGRWTKSFKPFSLNGPNLEASKLPGDTAVKVNFDSENKRWGGEYGKSEDAQYGPLTGEVSVKVWGQSQGNKVGDRADFGVQAEGKLGLGVKKKRIGGFACYFVTVGYKFSARDFGDALVR